MVIRPDGLIATIGYLVTEAEEIWLTTHDGRVIPGHALAYDFETGFGLIQALGKLDLPALPIETGDAAAAGRYLRASPAPAGGSMRSAAPSRRGRNSPAIGNTCWRTRSSPPPRIPPGAAPG